MDDDRQPIEYFHSLVDLEPDEQRQRLAESALTDEQKAEVIELLKADARDTALFLNPVRRNTSGVSTTVGRENADTSPADKVDDDTVPQPGQMLDEHRLEDVLGEGAFGSVWKAYDTVLTRAVAIKIPKRVDAEERARMLREARAVSRLNHRNILTVYSVVSDAGTGRAYIVTHLAQGGSLKEKMRETDMGPRDVARLVAKLANALNCAHASGIVHRDLKPENVLIDDEDEPLIADFGLAKQLTSDATHTIDGIILGTPAYMSPEQARGESNKVDGRSDIFSLGVMLFEMLTGERPFHGTPRVVIKHIIESDSPDPRTLNREVSRDLANICLKCLAKEPARRYQMAKDLEDDLNRWLNGEPVAARRVGVIGKCSRWCKRNPALATASTLFVASLITGIIVSSTFAWRATERGDQLQRQFLAQQLAMQVQLERDSHPQLGLALAIEAAETTLRVSEQPQELVAKSMRELCAEMDDTELLVEGAHAVKLASDGAFYSNSEGVFWRSVDGRQVRISKDISPVLIVSSKDDLVTMNEHDLELWQRNEDTWSSQATIPNSEESPSGTNTHWPDLLGLSPNGEFLATYNKADNQLNRFELGADGTVNRWSPLTISELVTLAVGNTGMCCGTRTQAFWLKHVREPEKQHLAGFNPNHHSDPLISIAQQEDVVGVSHFDEVHAVPIDSGNVGSTTDQLVSYPTFVDNTSFVTALHFRDKDDYVVGGSVGLAMRTHRFAGKWYPTWCDHQSRITCIAPSVGNSPTAIGTATGTVWLSVTGGRQRINRCINGPISQLRFVDDRDEQNLLAISGGGDVRVWHYEAPEMDEIEVVNGDGDERATEKSVVSEDGKWLVVYRSESSDSPAELISIAMSHRVALGSNEYELRESAFSSDSKLLATCCADVNDDGRSRIEIRNLEHEKAVVAATFDGRVEQPSLVWSEDNSLTGYSSQGDVWHWECVGERKWRKPISAQVHEIKDKNISLSATHDRIAVVADDRLTLLERDETFEQRVIAEDKTLRCGISPSGRFLAYLRDGKLHILDTSTNKAKIVEETVDLSVTRPYTAVNFSPDGKWLAVAHEGELQLGHFHDADWHWRTYALQGYFAHLEFVPDGSSVFAVSIEGQELRTIRTSMIRVDLTHPDRVPENVLIPSGTIFAKIDKSSSNMVTWGLTKEAGGVDVPMMWWDLTASPMSDTGVNIWNAQSYTYPRILDSGKIALSTKSQQLYIIDPLTAVLDPEKSRSTEAWLKRAKRINDQPLTPEQRVKFGILGN